MTSTKGKSRSVLVLHGPNLNLLGERETDIYGAQTLADINAALEVEGQKRGFDIAALQSNNEGVLIDVLHKARLEHDGVLFNPAGYTHTSVALRDAVAALDIPVVEVHLSNIFAREEFRQHSLIAPVCHGTISGFGWRSYLLALDAIIQILNQGA